MRKFKEERSFRQDIKRELRGRHRNLLKPGGELWEVVAALVNDIPLVFRYKDHVLHGDMEGKRECHIRPNLLLVYRYAGDDLLYLERLGSHAEIFGM